MGVEVSGALNPAQQVVKIVNEELVTILGGETRRLRFAEDPAQQVQWSLAGLQGAGKTTLAAKLALWLKSKAIPRCWWRATCSVPTQAVAGQR